SRPVSHVQIDRLVTEIEKRQRRPVFCCQPNGKQRGRLRQNFTTDAIRVRKLFKTSANRSNPISRWRDVIVSKGDDASTLGRYATVACVRHALRAFETVN